MQPWSYWPPVTAALRAKRSNPEMTGTLDCFVACAPRNDGGARRHAHPSLLQIFLHLRAQAVAQVVTRHAEGDVGAEKAGLGAAIMPLALELDAVEALRPGEADHGVGKLDFAAGAVLLGFQYLEDLRLQDIAPGDRQVGRRGALWRLFHHAVDLENVGMLVALADAADAVLMRQMRRHFFHRDQVGFVAELAGGLDHLLEAARRVQYHLVRRYDGEGRRLEGRFGGFPGGAGWHSRRWRFARGYRVCGKDKGRTCGLVWPSGGKFLLPEPEDQESTDNKTSPLLNYWKP